MGVTDFTGADEYVAGYVTGARAFGIDDDGFLTGVMFPQRWPQGVIEAQCWRVKAPGCEHERPVVKQWTGQAACGCDALPDPCGKSPGHPRCLCGLYGYFDSSSTYASPVRVSGVVAGWGRVLLGTRGFRAAKAAVLAIYLPPPTGPSVVDALRKGPLAAHLSGTYLDNPTRDRIRANYPDLPVYTQLNRMLADFPPHPGHEGTP